MTPDDFDLQTGVASVYWALAVTRDPVDPERDLLREDLIQVALNNGAVVDVGWYPSFSSAGSFKIFVVADGDWHAPVAQAECKSLAELERAFADCLARARRLESPR